MRAFLQDIRQAGRTLWKRPGVVFTAIVSLAVGIGINTSIFSILYTALERPVSGRTPRQLVDLSLRTPAGAMAFNYPEYLELRNRTKTFSDVIATMPGRFRVSGGGKAQMVSGVCATANFFSGFGQQPALGRGFSQEFRGPAEVVLTDGFWKRVFGADLGAVGRQLLLRMGEQTFAYTIVGVMPPDFRYDSMWTPDVLLPLPDDPSVRNGKARGLGLMARVRPGISMPQAQAESELLSKQLATVFPESFGKARLTLAPKVRRDPGARMVMVALQGVVGIVLLIACVNVMNLLLARHQERRAELATRLALGASRARLTRQLLMESMVLALPSALAGYGVAVLTVGAVEKMAIPGMPDIKMYFYLDGVVLAYALCAGIAATLIAGLWPAVAASKLDLVPTLRGAGAAVGGRKFGLRGALVVAQLSLSLVGITATAMLIKGVLDLNPFDPGVDPHKVLIAGVWPDAGYSRERVMEFRRRLAAQVGAQPGVQAVAFALTLPGPDSGVQEVVHNGSPLLPARKTVQVRSNAVGPGYFQALGIRILRGREFREEDLAGRPLCLVNETMARRFWPGQEPLGQRIRARGSRGETEYEVVGVARDTAYERTGNDYAPFLYRPMDKFDVMTLLMRTNGNATAFVEPVRRAVASLDVEMPVLPIGTLSDSLLGGGLGRELRLRVRLFGMLGGTALLLSVLGLYGVISYLVSRRTREIGIRIALGASRGDVLRTVIADGARLVSVGMAAGVGISLIVSPLLTAGLFGVKPNQPIVILAACGVLAIAAGIAVFIPARRACKADVLTALRYD